MDTIVRSYIKTSNRLVPIEDIRGGVPDQNYIYGTVECEIRGTALFTKRHCDLIDQLWAYIVEGLTKLRRGETYEAYFPDQPLRLCFRPLALDLTEVTIGHERHRLATASLVGALAEGAIEFFREMKRLVPNASETWDRYLAQARLLTGSGSTPSGANG